MILKNKALAIFDFLSPPAERLYDRAARFHFKGLSDVLAGNAAYEGEKTFVLQYFPEVAAALGTKALENAALAKAIQAEPMSALYLLLSNYSDLAARLEPIVLSSGEATYYLLKASREKKFKLAQADDVYFGTLLKDPFWGLRTWGDTQNDTLLSALLHLGKTQKDLSPTAAYIHLYFIPDAEPTDFVEALSTLPMYAYLSSRHFYDRGIEFKYFHLRGLTPRWAYHFITDGFLDDEEGLIETMLTSPDWLVEYLVESERYKDLPYTGGVVDRALKKAPANLQIAYLKLWWERTQEHVKKLPPPKPIKIPGAAKAEEEKKA